ncbi:MAG: rhamnulokinase, partial [Alistipes sp.]|nr:rhamnulokinase [Alistipes sp.]
MKDVYLAADFGGGSGRVMAGFLADGRLALEEIYRFPNRQIRLGDRLCWDFPALIQEMKNGIAEAVRRGYRVRSIGIDTWGVDFGLVDSRGDLLGNPVCYRDERTGGEPERFLADDDPAAHYARTGIQTMAINTLYQLRAMLHAGDRRLDIADRLLFMPDLLSFYLTGKADNEYTIASTSELLDAERRTWSDETIERAGLPRRLFGPIVMPGT